jgi:hypothetical protein
MQAWTSKLWALQAQGQRYPDIVVYLGSGSARSEQPKLTQPTNHAQPLVPWCYVLIESGCLGTTGDDDAIRGDPWREFPLDPAKKPVPGNGGFFFILDVSSFPWPTVSKPADSNNVDSRSLSCPEWVPEGSLSRILIAADSRLWGLDVYHGTGGPNRKV